MNKISEIESRLALLTESALPDNTGANVASVDNRIRLLHVETLSNVADGSLSYAEQNMDELLVQLNRRKLIVKTVSGYGGAIRECQKQRQEALAALSAAAETVTSPKAGTFFAGADGYEATFTQTAAEEMTYDDFYRMIHSEADGSLLSGGQGVAVGKLVTDSYWSVCCELDNRYLRQVQEGKSYEVIFPYNGGETISMTLDRIITRFGEERSVLVLGTRVTPPDFQFLRTQSIRLVLGRYEGYKLPSSAARFVNGQMGVYVLDGNQVRFRRMEVLYEVDGSYIVKPDGEGNELSLYDEVVVEGKGLYDGKYYE